MLSVGFFLHSFVVFPLANRILTSKRYTPRLRLACALAFLAAVAAVELLVNLQEESEVNYFAVLQVPRSATAADVKRSFRKLSLEAHPDKNREDPRAEARFQLLQTAHETLINDERREAYDRWGLAGLKWFEKSYSIVMMGSIDTFIRVLSWSVWTLLLTMSSSSQNNARFLAYCGLAVVFAVTVSMRFGDDDVYLPLLPHTTKSEKCEILWRLYPSFMMACVVVQNATHENLDKIHLASLAKLVQLTEALHTRLTVLTDKVNKLGGSSSSGSSGGNSSVTTTTNKGTTTAASSSSSSPPGRQNRVNPPVVDDADAAASNVEDAASLLREFVLQQQAQPGTVVPGQQASHTMQRLTAIPSSVLFLGLFLLVNFMRS